MPGDRQVEMVLISEFSTIIDEKITRNMGNIQFAGIGEPTSLRKNVDVGLLLQKTDLVT